jgi:hypothetical protein
MIKSILGGKSKNLCDLAYLLTLPLDKTFNSQGFWRVFINAEPNTTYTFSRENSNQITEFGNSYLAISTYDDIMHNYWLSHGLVPVLNYKSTTLTTSSDGKLWILFNENFYKNYWQKNLNPFGYIQLELGSTATEYVPHELTSYKSIMKVSDVCQLVDKSKFTASGTTNGITWVSNGDGSITLNGTCTYGFAFNPFNQGIPVDQTHFYYVSPYISINYSVNKDGTDETGHIAFIRTSAHPTKFNTVFYIWIDKDKSFSNVTTFINIDDLTEMFGAGNEPKTVAEFKAKFPNDYYPYSPSCFVTSYDERMPCKTKNLFSSSTEVGTLEGGFGGPTVTRNFEENKWYQGFTTNGYYSPTTVLDFDIRPNSLYVYSKGAGYGMSRAIKCESNTDYFISCSYSHISGGEGNVYVGYFDEGGNFISNLNMDRKYKFVITTPSNCKWLIINFVTRGVGKVYFSDIQLVKGTTATDYVPYGYV